MINPIVRRDMCHKNLLKIVNEMKELDWQGVIDENDSQSAYNKLHEIVSSKYNVCFSYHKFTKRYHMSQPWLSAALKQSINEKNKLFVIQKKQNDKENVIHFKKYRNILNQTGNLFDPLRENTTMTYWLNTNQILKSHGK